MLLSVSKVRRAKLSEVFIHAGSEVKESFLSGGMAKKGKRNPTDKNSWKKSAQSD